MRRRIFERAGWGLGARLAVLLAGLSVVAVIGASLYYNAARRAELTAAIKAQDLQRARATADLLDTYLAGTLASVRFIAMEADVVRLLSGPPEPAAGAAVNRTLQQLAQTHGVDAIYLADLRGRIVAASREDLRGQTVLTAPYFRSAVAGQTSIDELRFEPASGEAGLYFSAPVRAADGRIVGAAVGRASLAVIDRLVAADAAYSAHGGYGVLWDDQGRQLS